MGLGNGKYSQGNQGSNFNFELRLLEIQGMILAAINASGGGGCCPAVVRTPSLLRTSAPGLVPAGARSVSVFNAGLANGTWLGAIIKPGEQLTYEAGSTSDTLLAFAYDGTGTELVITSVV